MSRSVAFIRVRRRQTIAGIGTFIFAATVLLSNESMKVVSGVILFGGLLLAYAIVFFYPVKRQRNSAGTETPKTDDSPAMESAPEKITANQGEEDLNELSTAGLRLHSDPFDSTNVTQWFTRSLNNNVEIIDGGVRVDFDGKQRESTIHVAFCPPFQSIPEVTTENLDSMELEIRVAATFPFGCRLTVRRPMNLKEVDSETSYRIGFRAFAARAKRVA